MSKNSLNLALRFILELAAIASLIIWIIKKFEGIPMLILVISIPVLFASIWGIFAVKGDPSRSGKTVIQTPGWARLILEFIMFAVSGLALYAANFFTASLIFLGIVVLHYIISYDRILWLLRKNQDE